MSRTIALLRASLDSDLAWRFRQSPPAMVAALRETLEGAGIDEDAIRSEEFYGY